MHEKEHDHQFHIAHKSQGKDEEILGKAELSQPRPGKCPDAHLSSSSMRVNGCYFNPLSFRVACYAESKPIHCMILHTVYALVTAVLQVGKSECSEKLHDLSFTHIDSLSS